jgi:uncharacterized membrane protein YuzA (DUF378 family)
MIIKLILGITIVIGAIALGLIPIFMLAIPTNLFEDDTFAAEIIRFVAWLLPVSALMPIVFFSLTLDLVTVGIAIFKFIMKFIPFIG